MRLDLHLAILAPALVAGPAALGGEVLKQTIDVNDTRVVVTCVSTGDRFSAGPSVHRNPSLP